MDQKNIHSNFFLATCVPEKPLILSLVFLGVGNFDARYFLWSKISGLCIFLGLQYEAPSYPPSSILRVSPLGLDVILTSKRLSGTKGGISSHYIPATCKNNPIEGHI